MLLVERTSAFLQLKRFESPLTNQTRFFAIAITLDQKFIVFSNDHLGNLDIYRKFKGAGNRNIAPKTK